MVKVAFKEVDELVLVPGSTVGGLHCVKLSFKEVGGLRWKQY